MDMREGRIIILGMALGAALGGLYIFLMRLRGNVAEQESAKQAVSDLSLAEVFSIAVAAITLARRIATLSEPAVEATSK